MKLGRQRPSDNIEDRRGGGFGFPGGGGLPGRGIRIPIGTRRGGGLGVGGILVLLLVMWLLGVNPLDVLTGGGGQFPQQQTREFQMPQPGGRGEDAMRDFVARVLGTTEEVWADVFSQNGRRYDPPTLVLFSGAVQSTCGMAQSAMGPFYCPLDRKVYIDLSFYEALKNRLGAPGDFAQAYVIAHEVGHHVQNLLGTAERVTARRMRLPRAEANALSVRMELQADCYAGIWAARMRRAGDILEEGDIEEGLNAAAAIGDDRLQRRSQGQVVPDSFTHGTSEQRQRWFKRGMDSGDVTSCKTFGAEAL
jgi:predicted metalloprotease